MKQLMLFFILFKNSFKPLVTIEAAVILHFFNFVTIPIEKNGN